MSTHEHNDAYPYLETSPLHEHLIPLDKVNGFHIRPGFYEYNGSWIIPGGVSFTVHSQGATSCELLLFHRTDPVPYAVIPYPENYRIGFVYSMIVFDLAVETFEYAFRLDGPYDPRNGLLFDKRNILIDPYAKALTGQSEWGNAVNKNSYHARVVKNNFNWGREKQPNIPMEDLVIYEMHVRGFTKMAADVSHPGTFHAIKEKIPYLKDLGINAIELMPIFEFDEMMDHRIVDGKDVLNYWGYSTISFFAPNTSYTSAVEYNREGLELKQLIKELHDNDIEVILDVVFNHTAEGNEDGPVISFKGFDNNIYYLLTPEGFYYNFSGCGNTMNCNHPIVQNLILSCLRYWVQTYRIDGFRFDLASILGRNEDGSPMEKPPLLQALAFDPILGKVKLIAEAWDAGGLYQVGNFPSFRRWAEWNGRYRDDVRDFLKGNIWSVKTASQRIVGSPDIYNPVTRGHNASINFLTCHDGFTLYDLYSYNIKHNEANGWNNTDGTDDNRSWNCGVEGDTDSLDVTLLRKRMIKNACTVLLCSRGTPMFLSGDEFCNTQFGNNNPYCQDNEISWLDWTQLDAHQDTYAFFRFMIRFRLKHPALRGICPPSRYQLPEISIHSELPFQDLHDTENKMVGVLYAGYDDQLRKDDILYLAINIYWEATAITLPKPPIGLQWHIAVNTGDEEQCFFEKASLYTSDTFLLKERSVVVFIAT